MATTTNLGLKKPAYTDAADVADINDNMDIIDQFAGSANEAIAKIDGTKDQTISSGDLNSYTSTGLWRIGNMSALTHAPTYAGTTGILYVMKMSSYILQDFVNNTRRSSRFSYDGGSTWTDWQTVALNSEKIGSTGSDTQFVTSMYLVWENNAMYLYIARKSGNPYKVQVTGT